MAWKILFNMTEYMWEIDQEGHNIEPFDFGAGDGNYSTVIQNIAMNRFRVVNPNEITEDSNPNAILAKEKVEAKNQSQQSQNVSAPQEDLPEEAEPEEDQADAGDEEETSTAKKRTRK